jgi:hypothetical protein
VEADEGDYSCTAVGQEIVESRPARLTVTQIPAITGIRVTPANGIVPRGGAFSVELLLDGPTDGLTFEWHRDTAGVSDGPRITGATTPLLSVTAAEDGDAGNYTCTVRQGAEALTSPPGLVRVGLAFSVDLDDVALEAGQRFEWKTELTGAEFAVTYSWFRQTTSKAFQPLRDNERISGTDSSTLVIDPVSYGDAGQYVVYALDGADIAVSSIATMTVSESVPVLGALGLAMAAAALGLAGARARRRQA